jgi:hypothetical protein
VLATAVLALVTVLPARVRRQPDAGPRRPG